MMLLIKRFLLFCGIWLVLTLGNPSAWLVGLATAGAAALLSLRLLPPRDRRVRLWTVVALLPGFLCRSLLGGLDVAWRAFHPRLPLRPTWIGYRVRLPPGARVSLGNELSLMPGTLAAGTEGDVLYIHCLDGEQAVDAQIVREESRIGESIGLRLDASDD